MKEKLGQEPAFPVTHEQFESIPTYKGISKRFYAACAAMQGILANEQLRISILSDERNGHGNLADIAFDYADELLKQENE